MSALNLFYRLKQSFLSDDDINTPNNNGSLPKNQMNEGDVPHPETGHLSMEEELAMTAIQRKSCQLNKIISNIENCLLKLNTISDENESFITQTFDDILRAAKREKTQSINTIHKITNHKQNCIKQQMNELTNYQQQIEQFKDTMIQIKHENVMNSQQINDFIINRSATLINYHFDGSIHFQSLVNTNIKNNGEINIQNIYTSVNHLGVLDGCLVPRSPNIIISNIGYNSIEIVLSDRVIEKEDRAYSEEYKLEMLQMEDNIESNCVFHSWRHVAVVISLQFDIQNLRQNTEYLLRCSAKNKYGYSAWCEPKCFRTLSKNDDDKQKIECDSYQYIYLAPTQAFQDELLAIVNENGVKNETYFYFKKWKGFHVTIGAKLRGNACDESGKLISNEEIVCELSELGIKNGHGVLNKWSIARTDCKVSKWKIGVSDYIVLSLNDDNRLLNICSTYLRARGWGNTKQSNWNVTLALNNDLNKGQISQMVDIITGRYNNEIDWNWCAVQQNANGKVTWTRSYPVFEL